MRKFLVGACCVIVGLQIVAASAAVLVLGILAVMGGVRAPYAARPDSPAIYIDDPPRPTPAVAAVTRAAWDQPVANAPADPVPADPLVESILAYRDEVGSPLAGTLLAGDPESAATTHEMGAILARVSAESLAAAPTTASPDDAEPDFERIGVALAAEVDYPAETVSPLAAAAEHLYGHANQHESRGEFARADQLRKLARLIRREMERMGDSVPEGVVPPMPATPATPGKAENPTETPAADADAEKSAIPAS